MLNTVAGNVGLLLQALLFAGTYLLAAPRRGRSIALLYAALVAVDGYALVLLGAMLLGIRWQSANLVLLLAVVVALAGAPLRARLRRVSTDLAPILRRNWGAIAILAAAVLVQGVAAALAPELSIDGQLYHGPTLAQLVQHGTLWGWEAPNQYLFYTDLTMVSGLNLATFTGATVFDNGIQIPHLVLLMLAINAALRIRFPRSWVRMAFAALMVSAPVVWTQPRILYVDVAYAAPIVALVVMIATLRSTRSLDFVVAGIAGASIVAIKPAGILTGAFLLVAFAAVAVWRLRREGARVLPSAGRVVAAFAGPAVLASGFYLRNLVVFANPVYPVRTKVGPFDFPGIIDLSVFASGERGSGLVDPLRWLTYTLDIGDGILHGVTKVDYDPRSGGFGFVPLIVAALLLAILAAQAVWLWRRGRRGDGALISGRWRTQGVIVLLTLIILLVQPATFDARYVIGPTILLMTALLLTTVTVAAPLVLEVVAGVLALVAVVSQVAWTEKTVFPGLSDIRQFRALPEVYQPITPGGVWGRGESISWLPDDDTCYDIALQTSGGLSESGMRETAVLSTLPYALYGPALCNDVEPIQIDSYLTAGFRSGDPIPTADYLVLYRSDVGRWRQLVPDAAECWAVVQHIDGSAGYPTSVDVLRNGCR